MPKVSDRLGKQEQVAAGEMARQFDIALNAGEHGVRMRGGEGGAAGTVADDDQARAGALPADRVEGAEQQIEVFLRRQPADVDHRQFVVVQTPLRAQRGTASGRVEQAGVDGAAQLRHLAEAAPGEEIGQLAGRRQGRLALVVEAPQPGEGERRQRAGTVARHVLVEAGVEAGGDRDAETTRGAQRGPAQRAFGGDVDGLRPACAPAAQYLPAGRQTEAQAGITRQRRAVRQQGIGIGCGFVALSRADHADLVAEFAQAVAQAVHGQRNAVDFRWPGFRDDLDADVQPRSWRESGGGGCSPRDRVATLA